MLAAGIAVTAALCFALCTVCQHRAAVRARESVGVVLLLGLLRRPVWLFGLLAGGAGLALHALALSVGQLAVVQPLLVSGMLFAIPASVVLEGRRPDVREWAYAGVVVVGLALFLLAARPSGGSDLADQGVLGALSAASAAAAGGAAFLAAGPARRHRAVLLGLAAGISFGVVSALLKQAVGQVAVAPLVLLTSWPAYALVVIGIAGIVFTQTGYRAGTLAASQPALNIAEPVVAVAIGAAAFSEGLSVAPTALLAQIAGFLLMSWGVYRLTALTVEPASFLTTTHGPREAVARGRGEPGDPMRALIISGSVGAGHDGAAYELADRLRIHGVEVEVRDYLQALPRLCRVILREGYTASVVRAPQVFQWLFDAIERSRLVRGAMIAFCRLGDRKVRRWARTQPYGVVVSTYPLASQSLGHLRLRGELTVPTVTYLTDPAVHRSWVHSAVDHHLTVTSWAAWQGSQTYRVAMRPAGPLVPARFATAAPARAAELRDELGLDPQQRVALLVTGSLGLGDVAHSARQVLASGLVPLVLCGRNEALQRRLSAVPGIVALGWRDDVHDLMHAADVLVHNAGGLTFTEALVAGLPSVSYRCIPGHGLANAAALHDAGLAPWARTDEQFATALRQQSQRGRTPQLQDDPALHVLSVLRGFAAAPCRRDVRRRRSAYRRGRQPRARLSANVRRTAAAEEVSTKAHSGGNKLRPAARPSAGRRLRPRRKVRGALMLVAVAVLLAGAGGWVSAPATNLAEQRAEIILSAHDGQDTGSLPQPDRIGTAVIATEDSRFYRHDGIDAVAALRATISALSSSADPGGATLDVQLGKVLYGTTAGGPEGKVQQLVLGVKLDRRYTKAQILELYLNSVYYGHGFYGISAASRGYFGVAPAGLSWAQASLLAGLLQAPSRDDPLRHLPEAKARQAHVLTRLVETGRLSPEQARAAATEPLHLTSAPSAG